MPAARLLACLLLAGFAAGADAIEFRSVSDAAAVLYDEPSKEGNKLYILSRDYPVEVIITSEGWVRVRDDTGAFGWVEAKSLSTRRTVVVKVPSAEAHESPGDAAPVVFKAQQGVVLEFLGINEGWAKVRHRDGAAGYLKLRDLWGV
ncbi:MAG TPA: SH3 domain-containing protein [Burkholderiales bacterium]|nr:SH3 domain-containing protein [Burkholderiales bacterium]